MASFVRSRAPTKCWAVAGPCLSCANHCAEAVALAIFAGASPEFPAPDLCLEHVGFDGRGVRQDRFGVSSRRGLQDNQRDVVPKIAINPARKNRAARSGGIRSTHILMAPCDCTVIL